MWSRKQFEDAAQKIGDQYVASRGQASINDLACKVAQEGGLNPDGIRTVVRLANVAVFENMFNKAAAEKAADRMFEFSVGDPEQVIMALGNSVKTAYDSSQIESTYDRAMDYYGDMYPAEMQKTAGAVVHHVGVERSASAPLSRLDVLDLFKKAEARMADNQRMAEHSWFNGVEKAAQYFMKLPRALSRDEFEKNAVASLGTGVVPELLLLRQMTGASTTSSVLGDTEKLAHIQEYHVSILGAEYGPILNAIKEAADFRTEVHRWKNAIKQAAEQRRRIA